MNSKRLFSILILFISIIFLSQFISAGSFRDDFDNMDKLATNVNVINSNGQIISEIAPISEFSISDDNLLLLHMNNDFVDSSNYIQQITNLNSVSFIQDGKFSEGAKFNSNCIRIENSDSLSFPIGQDFAISMWFRKSSMPTNREVLLMKRSSLVGIHLKINEDGSLEVTYADGAWHYTNIANFGNYFDGEWHNIIINYDRDSFLNIYVDGSNVGGLDISSFTNSISTGSMVIGCEGSASNSPLDADLDEIAIFNRVLSEAEIVNHAGTPVSSIASNVIKPDRPINNLDNVSWQGSENIVVEISKDGIIWNDVNNGENIKDTTSIKLTEQFYYRVIFSDDGDNLDWINFEWTDYKDEILPEFPPVSFKNLTGIGMNTETINHYSEQIIFADAMKRSRLWNFKNSNGWEEAWHGQYNEVSISDYLDENGWPLEAPVSGLKINGSRQVYVTGNPDDLVDFTTYMYFGSIDYIYGEYVLLFEGNGTIILNSHIDDQNYKIDSDGSSTIRFPFNMTADDVNRFGIGIRVLKSDRNNHIKNIRVVIPGHEDTYEENPFYDKYLDMVSKYNVFRFMWLQQMNTPENNKLTDWDQMRPKSYYTQEGGYGDLSVASVAPEYLIEIANRANVDPWFSIPHVASDDYIRSFAELIYAQLETDKKVYVELSNELWNWGYPQAHYPNGHYNWDYWALRSAKIFEIFEDVFGDDKDRVVKVLASQAGYTEVSRRYLWQFYENQTNNPNKIRADAFAIAPYISGGLGDTIVNEGSLYTITVDEILDRVNASIETELIPRTQAHKELADQYGLSLITYEGGEHLVGVAHQGNTTLIELLHAATRHPRMEFIMDRMFEEWYGNGGELFVFFSFIGSYSRYGSFGVLETMKQETSPKYNSVIKQIDIWNPGAHVDGNDADGLESCNDRIQNQDETGIDCGGVCNPCFNQVHSSDIDGSGDISITELNNFVQSWKSSTTISLANLIEAIRLWKE